MNSCTFLIAIAVFWAIVVLVITHFDPTFPMVFLLMIYLLGGSRCRRW